MIVLERVTKRFPSTRRAAVEDLSLAVEEGEVVVLVGPSGCGKTTTLRMINRLIEPTEGRIVVDGRDVMSQDPVSLRRGIGYVIQSVGLLPHRTVRENLATVPRLLGWTPTRIEERASELVALFELEEDLLDRYPRDLSGGQQQRVGVARALAADPPVMLMDEPFGAVDPIVRARLQDQFLDIQKRVRKTIVLVTHDIDEALKMADRIAVLEGGGRLLQFAPPAEVLASPTGDAVERFVGAERGLRRLALVRVADVELERAPTVSATDTKGAVLRAMELMGRDWAVVTDGGRVVGWVGRDALEAIADGDEPGPRAVPAPVTPESSLRRALDAVVTSPIRAAVVVDQSGRYLGVLSTAGISSALVR